MIPIIIRLIQWHYFFNDIWRLNRFNILFLPFLEQNLNWFKMLGENLKKLYMRDSGDTSPNPVILIP